MAPSIVEIVRGMAFVVVGVLKVSCDRWQLETTAQGKETAHTFNHLIILLFMEQLLQMCLLPFFKAMERNWLGFQRFYHGDMVHRPNPNLVLGPRPESENLEDRTVPINVHTEDIEEENPEPVGACAAPTDMEVQEGEEDVFDEEQYEEPKRRQPSRLLCLLPGWLWVIQVILVHFGLDLTYGSSFIMLKGSMTIFTALLGVAFLAQQLFCHVWLGILLSSAGFAIAGLSDYLKKPKGGYEKYGVASGVLLILMSQICIACKVIYEEKYLRKHSMHPMKFLGGEGFYGFLFSIALLIVFCTVEIPDYYSYVIPKTRHLEDIMDAVIQLGNSWQIIVAFIGSIVLNLIWNYLGLFMVRDHGALPRIMVETLVWMFYWVVCLGLGWENFYVGQVPGLCVIAVGLLFYGNILPLCSVCDPRVADINLNRRMYLNREHHRYEPLEDDEEDVPDGVPNPDEPTGNNNREQFRDGLAARGASASGAGASADPDSSDEESIEGVKPNEHSGAMNRAFDASSSTDEDEGGYARGGTVPKQLAQSSSSSDDGNAAAWAPPKTNKEVCVEINSSSCEETRVCVDVSSSSSDGNEKHHDESDDELLSVEPQLTLSAERQRFSDSSSHSSQGSGGHVDAQGDERLLQA